MLALGRMELPLPKRIAGEGGLSPFYSVPPVTKFLLGLSVWHHTLMVLIVLVMIQCLLMDFRKRWLIAGSCAVVKVLKVG